LDEVIEAFSRQRWRPDPRSRTRSKWRDCGPAGYNETSDTVRHLIGAVTRFDCWIKKSPWRERPGDAIESANRRLCPNRRLRLGRAGRTQWLDRLAVLAALRFGCVLRCASRRA